MVASLDVKVRCRDASRILLVQVGRGYVRGRSKSLSFILTTFNAGIKHWFAGIADVVRVSRTT